MQKNIKLLEEYKTKLERLKEVKQKLEWEKNALLKELEELGFKNVKEATSELTKLDIVIQDKQKEFEDKVQTFKESYADILS